MSERPSLDGRWVVAIVENGYRALSTNDFDTVAQRQLTMAVRLSQAARLHKLYRTR